MQRRVQLLGVVAGLLCLAVGASAQVYKRYKEVPEIEKAEDGTRFVVADGVKYGVWKDDKPDGKVFFVNAETGLAQWHDPRGPAPEDPTKKTLEINLPELPKPAGSSLTVALVAMLPILLFTGGAVARIAYLQIHYPELLWPTKERKLRRRGNNGKVKAPKARGKMNQDGRGGRSNNT